MTDTVHIFGPTFSTFVRVVLLVCEEKGIPYTVGRIIDEKPAETHSPEHFKVHPFGKLPVMFHGDFVLAETASIVRYLDSTFGEETLQGNSAQQKAEVDQWCSLITHYVDYHVVRQFMLEQLIPKGENGEPRFDVITEKRPLAENALKIVEKQLGDKPYLVGREFTLADAMLAPMLFYNLDSPDFLNIVAHSNRLTAYTERLQRRESGTMILKPLSQSR
ncbi:glutathione S-transferase family protein [Gilvimarinus algae]|uniref:glutathione transferase n=1 Tax=Gilvimarinus algae TaxID=3058037 RepID=A0ABT8TLU2_9GAMM|nr:glutathione S-transferase family protein [Gilvimarinus sp. SDUM040014]MDO3383337.1 glutathione S-transferase family protein [Gilvimarinus sp. SDUM040014]